LVTHHFVQQQDLQVCATTALACSKTYLQEEKVYQGIWQEKKCILKCTYVFCAKNTKYISKHTLVVKLNRAFS